MKVNVYACVVSIDDNQHFTGMTGDVHGEGVISNEELKELLQGVAVQVGWYELKENTAIFIGELPEEP